MIHAVFLLRLHRGQERIFVLSTFEWKLNSNTSLAVQGALANRLQRRTDFKTQNGLRGLERGPTLGLWEIRTSFAKQDSWSEHSFYEKHRRRRKKRKKRMVKIAVHSRCCQSTAWTATDCNDDHSCQKATQTQLKHVEIFWMGVSVYLINIVSLRMLKVKQVK